MLKSHAIDQSISTPEWGLTTTLPEPVSCGAGECILLAGNVVVISYARNVHWDLFGSAQEPTQPDAISLVQAGARHLAAIRSRLTTVSVPAPVQLPRP